MARRETDSTKKIRCVADNRGTYLDGGEWVAAGEAGLDEVSSSSKRTLTRGSLYLFAGGATGSSPLLRNNSNIALVQHQFMLLR